MKKIKITFVLGVLFLSLFQMSCKKDKETDPDPVAPQIPELSTFEMEMSDDMSQAVSTPDTVVNTDTTIYNWLHSGANVFVWNVVITVNMIVPVAAYAEAFKHTATYNRTDSKWKWEYTVRVANVNYTAKLYAKLNGSNVDWEMYLSQAGGYTNFLWYTGTSRSDRTSGTWNLNRYPYTPQQYILVEWNRNSGGTVADIKYTNIVPNGAENGGYIHYGINQNAGYNAYYDIYGKSADNLIEIEWNRTSKNGRVRDQNRFLDANWHCWNTALYDMVCL